MNELDLKLVGSTFAESYEIVSVLGTGGTSTVYAARYQPMDQLVALKLLRIDKGSSAELVRRLKTEARNVSKLKHPNIVGVLRIHLSDDGIPFLVTELAEGVPLNELLAQRGGGLNENDFHKLFDALISGLEHAHLQGVIHCDLKPSNVIVKLKGDAIETARIVDFGISKYTAPHNTANPSLTANGIFGTPAYMSPEQCQGKKPDARSDIYSLGCMMYECAAGQPLFAGESVFDVIQQHLMSQPRSFADLNPPPKFSAAVESTILAALQKDPLSRPQSVQELRSMLHGQLAASPNSAGSSSGRPRKKLLIAARVVGITVIAIISTAALRTQPPSNSSTSEQETEPIKEHRPILPSHPTAKGLFEIGDFYQRTHRDSDARDFFQRADEASARENKNDMESLRFRLRIKENLAVQLTTLRLHSEARPVLMQALALAEKIDQQKLVKVLEDLSSTASSQGDHVGAVKFAQRSVDAAESNLEDLRGFNKVKGHQTAGEAYRNLYDKLLVGREYAAAEKAILKALAHDQQQVVRRLVLDDRRRLAALKDKTGKFSEAIQIMNKYDEDVKSFTSHTYDDLSEFSFGYENFGDFLHNAGRFSEADQEYQRSINFANLAGRDKLDYNLATRMHKRAKNLYSLSQIADADETYKSAEEHFAKVHPDFAHLVPFTPQQRGAEMAELKAKAMAELAAKTKQSR